MNNLKGYVSPGVVGRLNSGHLILVERVERYAAFLRLLPEQDGAKKTSYWDARLDPSRTVAVSPFLDLVIIDPASLSKDNRAFLQTHLSFKEPQHMTNTTRASAQRRDARLLTSGDRPKKKRHAFIWDMVQDSGNVGITRTQIIEECLTRPEFQKKTSRWMVSWVINDLRKTGSLVEG